MSERRPQNPFQFSPSEREALSQMGARSRGEAQEPSDGVRVEHVPPINWANPGWITVLASLALAAIGLYGIDLSGGLDGRSARLDTAGLVKKQSVFIALGIVTCAVFAVPHFRLFRRLTVPASITAVALLVFVLLPFVPEAVVTPRNGARRWISLGFTDFQPSELAKLAFVFATALYLRDRTSHRTVLGLAGPALIALVPVSLILVEPDLGTSLLFFPALFAMLVAAGAKLAHLLTTGAISGVFAVFVVAASLWFAEQGSYPLLRPHQVERIQAVSDQFTGREELHKQDRGFQGYKARTLIGSGGVAGLGETRSRALVEYSRLPEGHNDMIFAVIANRFGFLGAIAVVGLYVLWFASAIAVAGLSKDPFGRLVAVGLGSIVLAQGAINIGMTAGVLPITGMTLPFVSYGGSSLVTVFAMSGIVLNVGLRRPDRLWRRSFEFAGDAA